MAPGEERDGVIGYRLSYKYPDYFHAVSRLSMGIAGESRASAEECRYE
jgi:hypothetical protein